METLEVELVEPITLTLLAFAAGGGIGGVIGWAFGESSADAALMELEKRLLQQAKVIEAQQQNIDRLLFEVNLLREKMNLFHRFVWYVFRHNPELSKAFSEIEKSNLVISQTFHTMVQDVDTFASNHPNHRGVDALRKIINP